MLDIFTKTKKSADGGLLSESTLLSESIRVLTAAKGLRENEDKFNIEGQTTITKEVKMLDRIMHTSDRTIVIKDDINEDEKNSIKIYFADMQLIVLNAPKFGGGLFRKRSPKKNIDLQQISGQQIVKFNPTNEADSLVANINKLGETNIRKHHDSSK